MAIPSAEFMRAYTAEKSSLDNVRRIVVAALYAAGLDGQRTASIVVPRMLLIDYRALENELLDEGYRLDATTSSGVPHRIIVRW